MAYDHLKIEARWGTILGEDNERMSKSRGNVVNPDDIGREYGADSLRLYEMFTGPLEAVKPWQTSQIQGVSGFGPLWLPLGATSWIMPGWMLNHKCLTHLKGLPLGLKRPKQRDRTRPDGAAPASLMVSTHRAMVTTARCTESRADMMV